MISLCTITRNTPHVKELVEIFKGWMDKYEIESEICIADSSTDPKLIAEYKEIADEYIFISDKEVFKMGLPWAHNRIAAIANSYNIFYVDADEFPLWIHPKIEEIFETSYIPMCMRADFCSIEEIRNIHSEYQFDENPNKYFNGAKLLNKDIVQQERLYNCRYTNFYGVCHGTLQGPNHFYGRAPVVLLFHNQTARDARAEARHQDLINEQSARQNINPTLASSKVVFGWGKGYTHKFDSWKEFSEAH